MEIELKESLVIYAQSLPDGHPLKDIAITTVKELSRANPFDRKDIHIPVRHLKVARLRNSKHFNSIEEACLEMDLPLLSVRNSVQSALKKYGLKLI